MTLAGTASARRLPQNILSPGLTKTRHYGQQTESEARAGAPEGDATARTGPSGTTAASRPPIPTGYNQPARGYPSRVTPGRRPLEFNNPDAVELRARSRNRGCKHGRESEIVGKPPGALGKYRFVKHHEPPAEAIFPEDQASTCAFFHPP